MLECGSRYISKLPPESARPRAQQAMTQSGPRTFRRVGTGGYCCARGRALSVQTEDLSGFDISSTFDFRPSLLNFRP
jgi:hypothetical protein